MVDIKHVDIQANIVDSITEIFTQMLSMEVALSDSEPPDVSGTNRVLSTLSFTGNILGALEFAVTQDFACLMTAQKLGIKPEDIDGEIEFKSLIAEISSILGDKLKNALIDAGQSCLASAPTIICGSDFSIKPIDIKENQTFVFQHQQNTIFVGVRLNPPQSVTDTTDTNTSNPLEFNNKIEIDQLNALDLEPEFSQSLVKAFDRLFSMKLEPDNSKTAINAEDFRHVVTTNLIGDVTGVVSLQVMDQFSREMTAKLLGVDVTEIQGEKEINDMFGELGSIVASNLTLALSDAGFNSALATPFLITGSDFTVEPFDMDTFQRFVYRYKGHILWTESGVKAAKILEEATTQGNVLLDEDDQNQSVIKPKDEEQEGTDLSSTAEIDGSNLVSTQFTPDNPSSAAKTKQSSAKNSPRAQEDLDLDLLLDIPLDIKVELGRTRIQIHELLNLVPGSAVRLSKLDGEPVDILANDTLIARGEVVVQREKYGIRVTEITSRMDRIRSFRM